MAAIQNPARFWDLPKVRRRATAWSVSSRPLTVLRVSALSTARRPISSAAGTWFVGDGSHFESWEGTEANYEKTEQIVRAAVQGQCRYWWSREEVGEFLRPWRKRYYWEQHSEIVLPDGPIRSTYAGGGVFPKDGEPEQVQAAPY